MKKFLLSVTFIAASVIYVVYQNTTDLTATLHTPTTTSSPTNTIVVAAAPQPAVVPQPKTVQQIPVQTPVASPPPQPKPTGQYVDGTYTGTAADAYYGTIQVQATISGGKLTDVTFLQYPNDRSTSREINSQAMPLLRQEAIQVQSANVDGVSGATDTSQAFVESLSSALTKAKS